MRIESITIKNFRQYGNVKFNFTNTDNAYDIHIVLGDNGTGKSNMLNAITWCLYGEEMHLGDKEAAMEKLSSEMTMLARENGMDKLVVEVSMTVKTDDSRHPKIHISRYETYRIGKNYVQTLDETFNVQELDAAGNWETYDVKEDKESTISRHIPKQINEYIFFDGEQLEKYFQNTNRDKLRDSINNLTQVTLVNQAISALSKYQKSELTPRIKEIGNDVINQLQTKIDDVEASIASHKENIKILKGQKEKIEDRIKQLSAIISNNEQLGEKKERYSDLVSKLEAWIHQKESKNHELFLFVREQYTLFGLNQSLLYFYKYIKHEAELGHLPPHFDKSLLMKILQEHKCAVCGQSVEGDVLNHVQEVIDKINVSTGTAAQLNQALSILKHKLDEMCRYPSRLNSIQNDLKMCDAEIRKCEDDIVSLKKYLDGIPGQDQILEAIKEKETAESTRSECDQKIGKYENLCQQGESSLSKLNSDLQDAMKKMSTMEDILKKKNYIERCIEVLHSIKSETTEETRKKMQTETFQIFQSLIWKKGMFDRVEIDEDYSFKLFDKYGNQTLGSCSAAERALLALSFTLALQDVSGHSSLLLIDTPIGRVDTENRENFIKNLLNVSVKKQVILTFTPSEYDINVAEILNGKIATFTKLELINGITTIANKTTK